MAAPVDLLKCLSDIVGLSPTITTDSRSGYYITDQKDGIPINFAGAVVDFESSTAVLLRNARADTVRNFLTDLSVEFSQMWKSKFPEFNGNIGKIEQATAITGTRNKAVVELRSRGLNALMEIRGLKMFSSLTGSVVSISIYNSEDITTPLKTVSITTQANKWVNLDFDESLIINLFDRDLSAADYSRYFIVWDIPSGDYARKNRVWCCNKTNDHHANYVDVVGRSVNSLSELTTEPQTAMTHGETGMGISINASIACDFSNFLCSYSYKLFNASGFQWALAKTLQHGCVMNTADKFIKSQNINQYTLLSKEAVYGIRSHAEKEYYNGIKYLVENMPEGALGCFECKSNRYAVRSILV